MSASDHLNPIQFHFNKAQPKSMGGSPFHAVSAMDGGRQVGQISWNHKSGEIRNILVDNAYRRQGIGTGLYRQAQNSAQNARGVKSPRHSADRTDLGEVWAHSLGERLPRRSP